jgi:hypothetical protein
MRVCLCEVQLASVVDQSNVITGARLFSEDLTDMLFKDEKTLHCAALTQLDDFGVIGITEYFAVSVCLFLHEFSWPQAFKRCCVGRGAAFAPGEAFHLTCPELVAQSQENVRSELQKEENTEREEEDLAHYMDEYLHNSRLVGLARKANTVDCHIYNFGLQKFTQHVRAMETATHLKFLPSEAPSLECDPL